MVEEYKYVARLITTTLPPNAVKGVDRYQIYEEFTVIDPITEEEVTNHRVVMTQNMTALQAQAVMDAINKLID